MSNINKVTVRMYCLGTGDCMVVKFFAGKTRKYTMMIDCGSCQGTAADFTPYVEDLAEYVKEGGIDLLVVTHEHNDHVNGFAKCSELFSGVKIKKAWMAWTEEPGDPEGKADDLLHKRKKMREALANAITELNASANKFSSSLDGDYNQPLAMRGRKALMDGLDTLAEINLGVKGKEKEGLPGMIAVKERLKKVPVKYVHPGETIKIKNCRD